MSIEIAGLAFAVLVQITGIAFFYGRLTQKQTNLTEKLEELIASQKEHRDGVQETMEQLWASMTSRFEKIFDNYLKTEDATRFFVKKGEKKGK